MATSRPSSTVEVFSTIDSLPAESLALFSGNDPLFSGLSWWKTVLDTAMPYRVTAQFVLIRLGGAPAALFPMQIGGPAGFGGLTTPYSCLYGPLLAPSLNPLDLASVFAAFGRFCRAHPVTRLDALPAEWPHLDRLIQGCTAAGLVPLRFDHFGNWYEPVADLNWAHYLDGRPGALRETIRRRLRRTERLAGARFVLLTTPEEVEAGIPAFEDVYARSWKEPEPFPCFNAALIRATSHTHTARLGLWFIGNIPVATQFWVVERGHATVLKLAHDEAFKAHSPGTVLSALMLRHLLDREHVTEIDYGRGDDPYKQGWARNRRLRIGLLLATPWRPRGLVEVLNHKAGQFRAWIRPAS